MVTWRATLPLAVAYSVVASFAVAARVAYTPVAVRGGSMSPALSHGDIALVRMGVRAEPGDIVLIQSAGHEPVLHRVRRAAPGGRVITRGDANPVDDLEPASASDVRGVVKARVPLGTVLRWWRPSRESDTLSAQSDTARL